jgi:cytochrome c-type biogenesis protein
MSAGAQRGEIVTKQLKLMTLLAATALLSLSGCPKPDTDEVVDPGGASSTTAQPGKTTAVSGAPTAGWTGDIRDFSFITHEGRTVRLSDYAGQPIVLNFWADWCPPCVGEMPEFQAAYSASGGKYVLVSITDSTSKDPRGFVASGGYDWVFGISDEAARMYVQDGWPTTLFIDPQGNIKYTQVGGITRDIFESHVARII